jgi:two-component system, OmpR family, phosphate regulon sensor histidine kinase PhoR
VRTLFRGGVSVSEFVSARIGPLRDALFFFAQLALLGGVIIVAATLSGEPFTVTYTQVVPLGLVILAITVLAALPPWQRLHRNWLIIVAVADIVILAQLRAELFHVDPGLSILVLIPTLWLCYVFGVFGVVIAVLGDYVVALSPYLISGGWPSSSAGWGTATLLPAIVSGVGLAVYGAAVHIGKQQSELRATYEQLRDSESTAVAVVNNVDAGITFYAADGSTLLTNDTAQQFRVLSGDTRIPEPRALDSAHPVWLGTGAGQRAVTWSARRIARDDGELLGTLVASYDVTDLTKAIEARDEFLTTISHELRTPLTSIIGYLELIEESPELESIGIAAEVAVVHRNSDRLLQLITALLGQASSPQEMAAESIELSHLIDGCVATMRRAAGLADVLVESQFLEPVSALVDRDQLRVVIENVLSNAIKFTPAGGHVSVSLAREGADAVVRVADDGLGIPASERARIFDPFFRGVVARNRVSAGTGLGLSTAKTIMTAHGGTIQAHNVDSGGTIIEIRVPIGA